MRLLHCSNPQAEDGVDALLGPVLDQSKEKHVSTVEFGTSPRRIDRSLARRQGEELRSNRGQEGKIRTYPRERMKAAHSYANHINAGRIPAFRDCDAWAVTVGEEVQVWARCITVPREN
jgi:hypothetical protein